MWAALLKGVDLENQGQCLHAIHYVAEADLARVYAQRPESFVAEVHRQSSDLARLRAALPGQTKRYLQERPACINVFPRAPCSHC
jgi:hypothetical protein